jgi:multimeric flavodoxin WrbA
LDRAFYVSSANGNLLRHKVGASVVAVRRSGGVPAFNQLNNYLNYAEMMVPSSNYWNVIHGSKPGDALQDEEGVQIMRVLGKNMAYMMKLMDTKEAEELKPDQEKKVAMSFIR